MGDDENKEEEEEEVPFEKVIGLPFKYRLKITKKAKPEEEHKEVEFHEFEHGDEEKKKKKKQNPLQQVQNELTTWLGMVNDEFAEEEPSVASEASGESTPSVTNLGVELKKYHSVSQMLDNVHFKDM